MNNKKAIAQIIKKQEALHFKLWELELSEVEAVAE
jgi:hypothetical protein